MRYVTPGVALIFSGCVVFAGMGLAQTFETPPAPEALFRRVTPPGPGHTGPRITIQIGPEATTPAAAPGALPSVDLANPQTEAAWFWAEISPALPPNPARFWEAQRVLAAAPETSELSVPRLAELNALASRFGQTLLLASLESGVSPALLLAVMAVESAGAPDAVSAAGAEGLMQLMPATAAQYGVDDPFDPAANIQGGAAYLGTLLERFDRDPVLALAAYNAGPGAVERAGGVPEFDETRRYVPKVIATWSLTRNLCRTPPDLVFDGCVFVAMSGTP